MRFEDSLVNLDWLKGDRSILFKIMYSNNLESTDEIVIPL